MDIEEICCELVAKLRAAVHHRPAEGLLLSGGLDSSILAALVPGVKAITAGPEGTQAPDERFSAQVAAAFELQTL